MRVIKLLSLTRCALVVLTLLPVAVLAAGDADMIPLDAAHWSVTRGSVEFATQEGFPSGLLVMKAVDGKEDPPVAALKEQQFESGTIEFDVKPDGDNWPTVRFHKTDEQTADEFYVRPSDDCAASHDCAQYAPEFNGRMLWDSFYQYQHAAPFHQNEWNHIKMVISGRRMNVYFNREQQPSLQIGELMDAATRGAIEFQGPAKFANVVVRSGWVEGLSPQAEADPTRGDAGYVRSWTVTRPIALDQQRQPALTDAPAPSSAWQRMQAERFGLVDLARRFGPAPTREVPLVAWLKTTIRSDRARVAHVSLGFARRVTVFINGELVYSGRNLYNTPAERQQPDGRLNVANGSFEMTVRKGNNQILVGLSSNDQDMRDIYSFGLEFRISNPQGLLFAR